MVRRFVLVILVLGFAGVIAFIAMRRDEVGVEVEIQPASVKEVFRSFVTASGEIVATRYADIGSNAMGKVVSLPVVEGQRVRANQLLARIDPVQAQADFDASDEQVRVLEAEAAAAREEIVAARAQIVRAEAMQREAQLRLARMESLFSQGVAPEAELDSARAEFDTARADVSAARANLERSEKALEAAERRTGTANAQRKRAVDLLSKTEIRSPIAGVVSRLQVREGEMVVIGIQNQPGTTLMTISDLSGVNAEVKVAEADILRVELGQEASVTLDAVRERSFVGTVIEIGTSALAPAGAGTAAREFRVVIRIENPETGLRPGLTCDAEILTTELSNVVAVPLQAVVIRDIEGTEKAGVFLAQDGKARFVEVTPGVIGGLEIVVDGINEGAPVISGPFQILRELQDGSLIREQTAT